MMLQEARVILKSQNPDGHTIITWSLSYWLPIHAEMLTHKAFRRNAASNRAIPTKKILSRVMGEMGMPLHWGVNKPGMQADEELTGIRLMLARGVWRMAGYTACAFAWTLGKIGLHKQAANRVLMPYQMISVVITTTDRKGFYALRVHKDAQPEMQDIARKMQAADKAAPIQMLDWGEWHIPYADKGYRWKVLTGDRKALFDFLKTSVALCARTSYLTHEGKPTTLEENTTLHERLRTSIPMHASPFEHQAVARRGNWAGMQGFENYRTMMESSGQVDYEKYIGF